MANGNKNGTKTVHCWYIHPSSTTRSKIHYCIYICLFLFRYYSTVDHGLVYYSAAGGPLQLNSLMLFGQRSTHTWALSVLLKINSHTCTHIHTCCLFVSPRFFPQPFHQSLHPPTLSHPSITQTHTGRQNEPNRIAVEAKQCGHK